MFNKKKYDFSQYSDYELEQVIDGVQETNALLAELEDESDWHRQVRDNTANQADDELRARRSIRNLFGF